MSRVAIIGDVGGHADQLRRALDDLPPDLTVIQVGDLVDRGPASAEVLDIVQERENWFQLVGNHEAQYLPEGTLFWPDPIAPDDVTRLRQWWADGRMHVAAAITTADDDYLITHAGLTVACWEELGEPATATEAANRLNERPGLIWRMGDHARDERSGPLWAESGAALHEPWMSHRGVVPFGQIHGHSSIVHYPQHRFTCDGRIRQRATVDWDARHVRVRVGGRLFVGVDPKHGRTGASHWQPLIVGTTGPNVCTSPIPATPHGTE